QQSTVLVFDNMESILPGSSGINPTGINDVGEMFLFYDSILKQVPTSRIIFTTRERLPSPFNNDHNTLGLNRLPQLEAILLVERVMRLHGELPATDDVRSTEQIIELVNTVDCHPRALVLLAGELKNGLTVTLDNINSLMTKLEVLHPGDRENSLYASIELSIRRLPEDIKASIHNLAYCNGGGVLPQICMLMNIEPEKMMRFAAHMINVGIGEYVDGGYMRLDPALPGYLKSQMGAKELGDLRGRWISAMLKLVEYIIEQKYKGNAEAYKLTLLELPNLLALLNEFEKDLEDNAEIANWLIGIAGEFEETFSCIGHPHAMQRVIEVREKAAKVYNKWDHNSYTHQRLSLTRMIEAGDLQQANDKIQELFLRFM
ncbi:MAG: hypothetical protein MJK04_06165, partial [Psychrosphaera sp.]|nr:hypothetical protein [Psychrosphaera sp.]